MFPSPDGTLALNLFWGASVALFINDGGNLGSEADAVERTTVIWLKTIINHLHKPQVVPGTH